MFRIFHPRRDIACLTIALSFSSGGVVRQVNAPSVHDQPQVQVAPTVHPIKNSQVQETVPAPSLVSLIEAGQFLPPSAPQLSVNNLATVGTAALDMRAAVRQALTSYPDILRAREGVNEQVQRVEVAQAGYYPRISGGAQRLPKWCARQSQCPGLRRQCLADAV